jgi:E3 ubiquitin-protein ligase TRIP12
MSSRVTRSSARQAASQAAQSSGVPDSSRNQKETTDTPIPAVPVATPARKRPAPSDKSPSGTAQSTSSSRKTKRQKLPGDSVAPSLPADPPSPTKIQRLEKASTAMDTPDGQAGLPLGRESALPSSSSSRKSSRGKRAPLADQGLCILTSSWYHILISYR